jgi:hypothetical protein
MTDHDLLSITIPVYHHTHPQNTPERPENDTAAQHTEPQAELRVGDPTKANDAKTPPGRNEDEAEDIHTYRWIEGECLKEYSASAEKWK